MGGLGGGDAVAFVKPFTEVEELAFLGAEGEVGVVGDGFVIERLAAMATFYDRHVERLMRGFEGLFVCFCALGALRCCGAGCVLAGGGAVGGFGFFLLLVFFRAVVGLVET